MLGQTILASLRFAVALRPSVATYSVYRLLMNPAARLTAPAAESIYSDLLGGGTSPLFRKMQDKIEGMMTVARLASYYVGGRLRGDRANFRVGAALNLSAALVLIGMRETLRKSNRCAAMRSL